MEDYRMLDKKEAIKRYKQTIQPMGIFRVKNLANGKVFIDSSKNLNSSLNSNQFQLKLGAHRNRPPQEDYNSFGEDQFVFEILDQLKPKDDDPAYDYTEDLEVLKSIWLEKIGL
ncbi:MAG: hypothetical protein A2487_09250 [Candidatus Raymondbacteria bacterium RifOxyC12_full_50_8]|uniref:GIY-YIG domain-containing protein n=1 Tax=Candidatus Raymondbacteria bacterium RIFOXYD12_FULL_49_13 TaxID=1817890 RepID=A0A1F7FFM9_UNCRA|nr:MAG: hypothetical protein A2248_22690 [Candidatus Raymondbacteria bacterium RIFOXYA2_FULL_49_16]OGJ94611.1 MAG: hypothetical protein A2350_05980 [Candidatus Raymondbacteria bacterium RifOxyB12_full_50_8]OGJ98881.1 MAG: hypothetical protein A2487_09250 [Candidatus Raymondbacteria bacterium RifOxyC12_full_50_8]OGK05401.1 MAG: hypothetical protein A2519_03640 [Candidatus Raymondbacteria bacterium RIFOXYD12_FULL_49_13]OGP43014.1 MAG: hypothetical protein A2324_16345 [Candidatus Raymondbacteria b